MKEYMISVIIPIYNTAAYLEETIECVVNQTIGFGENIQLILVNDASSDDSGTVCEKYKRYYPQNIVYISLSKNQGQSKCRNTGMRYACGKYITFLDSDDKWSLDAFKQGIQFLELHQNEIDLISANVIYFDGGNTEHILNQDLSENAIINCDLDYRKIRSNGPTCIFRKEVALQYSFDETQRCWEDTKFLNAVMLNKKKYGMLADAKYLYRIRKNQPSYSQGYSLNMKFYEEDLELLCDGCIEESRRKYNIVTPMIQYLIAYALWARMIENPKILSENEMAVYKIKIVKYLQVIEDRYICELSMAKKHIKLAMLSMKYSVEARKSITYVNKRFYFNDTPVFDVTSDILSIWNISQMNECVTIEGRISLDIGIPYQIIGKIRSGKEYEAGIMEWLGEARRKSLNQIVWNLKGYVLRLPKADGGKVQFYLRINGEDSLLIFDYFDKADGTILQTGDALYLDQ